jgi:hypothetical protein
MTSSPDHGDFQDIAVWLAPPLTPTGEQSIPVGVSGPGVQWVGSYASLQVLVAPSSGTGNIAFEWYQDAAGLIQSGAYDFLVAPGYAMQMTLPILGPYVSIVFTNSSASAASWFMYFTPSNVAAQNVTYTQVGNIVNPGSVSYGASSTTNYNLPFLKSGWAHIHLSSPTVSGVLVAKLALTVDGSTVGNEIYGHAYTGFLDDVIWIPPVPLLLQVSNTDTAAHSAVLYFNGDS